jgi:hypothetical protein
MTKRIEVTLTFGDKKVSLEGPEDFVREEVERLVHGPSGAVAAAGPQTAPPEAPSSPQTERQLVEQKLPDGHAEIVAVLAFSLRERGVTEFTAEEIRKAYIRANVRPPKVVAQALRDAKNKYELIEPGTTKGTYRLSPHGERTVLFDLPRRREGR